ncbi:ABC transporter permease [Aggregicoccus sp. 17bor-14]|uniref:ABC transporter permease n=1 Tax=Myxococcaceae TaxID=31 RepID=UPI00129D1531|nr:MULTISPECIES: ABC transporter permease [Myxococcaceae]MBF5044534.1 ABC transporter permease [Simulacricoccus sp. 17bor-14]MRI90279.1 ABC transporter permease [Aggregicoccus sp. 17bor-14]
MNAFVQDTRYALRSLARARSFALAAILTLALGVGANSTIFSIIDSLWFKAFPFPREARVVELFGVNAARGLEEDEATPYEYAAWRDSGAFESLAAYGFGDSTVRLGAEPERARVTFTTPQLFGLMRARPELGRFFTAEEDVAGHDGVAVLSHDVWVRRFGADPGVLGRSVTVEGVARTVVGVLPRDAQYPPGTQVWVPLALTAEQLAAPAGSVLALGSLKPGLTDAQALQLAKAASKRVEEARPETNAGWSVTFEHPREQFLGDARIFLVLLSAAVGLVLLIACANVANLLLARGSLRQRELAVRAALGAGRGRLVRQMLTESLLLAAAGSALGLLLARWGVDLVVHSVPAERAAAIPGWLAAAVDGRAVAFTAGLTLLTTLVFGLLPALRASRVDPQKALRAVGGTDPSGGRLRGALVVAEVALSVVLLTCAALLMQSLVQMRSAPVGFEPRGLLTLQVGLGGPRYARPEAREQFLEQLLPRLEQLPNVERAGALSRLPLGGSYQTRGYNVGGRPLLPPTEQPAAEFRLASPGGLEALGVRLVSGRAFTASDRAGAPPVVLVNEAFARSVFPGEDPLGKQLLLGPQNVPHLVVGVVTDLRGRQLRTLPRPELLRPLAQGLAEEDTVSLVLRARAGDPLALAPQVRALLAELDPEVPASQVRTYARVIDDAIAGERVAGRMLAAFALVALVLAAVGVYGVVSYSVSERTYEMGVRMALGARAGDVRRQVLGGSLRLAGTGVALGTVAALGLAHLISSVLFGVSPRDPATYLAIAGALLTVALVAAYAPARRATRVDPAVALRSA